MSKSETNEICANCLKAFNGVNGRRYTEHGRRKYMRSYLEGVTYGLDQNYQSMKPTSEETGLMVCHNQAIEDFLKNGNFHINEGKQRKRRKPDIMADAFLDGEKDGRNVSLNQQIKGGSTRKPVEWHNKYCRIIITVSQSPNGMWDYGYDYTFHQDSGCGGAMFVDKDYEGYRSQKFAITSCLKFLKKNLGNILKYKKAVGDDCDDFGNWEKNSTIIPYLEKGMVQIDALIERYDPRQLDLFENM